MHYYQLPHSIFFHQTSSGSADTSGGPPASLDAVIVVNAAGVHEFEEYVSGLKRRGRVMVRETNLHQPHGNGLEIARRLDPARGRAFVTAMSWVEGEFGCVSRAKSQGALIGRATLFGPEQLFERAAPMHQRFAAATYNLAPIMQVARDTQGSPQSWL
ncbi:hypothetical protein BU16DRAFT_537074 [Lophium mytilinum]|uniref:Uncharacterized protein n=1 Tax=Lophium mytilinum TaxID=390894 RepID=A0A6A6QZ91_9PEZI|nr:hypothetical protein BU16DRAFT_537074 [Lophium mytilinum]